jgi:hypothetical protein
LKNRRPGLKRPALEQVTGDDQHKKSGKWMVLLRVIDRENNWYYEVVKDPETSEIIHESSEPLSEHTKHGFDMYK